MNINRTIILILLSLINNIAAKNNNSEKWITIFIHGTVGIESTLDFSTFRQLLRDNVEQSEYRKKVLEIRKNCKLFHRHPMQHEGLHKIRTKAFSHRGPYAFAKLYDQVVKIYNPDTQNFYYTFGWSGLISCKLRYQEAGILYNYIKAEIARLQNLGHKPKVRIIGYSHGATLGLYLGGIRDKCYPEDKFKIDEFISVGMPVLYSTKKYLFSDIFSKLYHIYSNSDYVPFIDVFAPGNIISHRLFVGKLPENLKQLEIKVVAKLSRVPGKSLPRSMCSNVDQSPGHAELWYFGPGKHCRSNLYFSPLPIAIFIPYFIDSIKYLDNIKTNNIKIDIRPEQETATIESKKPNIKKQLKFVSKQEISRLKNILAKI